MFATRKVRPAPSREPHRLHDPPLLRPGEPGDARRGSSARACASRKRRGFSVSARCVEHAAARSDDDRVSLARERRAEETRGWVASGGARARRVIGSGPSTRAGGDVADREARRAPTPAPPARRARPGRRRSRGASISSRKARRCGGTVLPWKRFQLRTSTRLRYFDARAARRPARVHALVRPRARRRARRAPGADVELATSRFRFGERPGARRLPRAASGSTRSRRGSSSARGCGCR